MHLKKFLLITAVFISLGAPAARAEIFQWGNPEVSLSVTFPDTWRRIAGQQSDDVITIAAPGDNDFATCRLRVDEDRRFVIYPRRFAAAIQHENYSRDFWDGYVGQFRSASINTVSDNAGLGKGFASWADVSFIAPAGPQTQMRGIIYATVYNDHAYVLECSAEREAFPKWHHAFLSVLKSVDMRPEYATSANAKYRHFQKDGLWFIHGEKETDRYIY